MGKRIIYNMTCPYCERLCDVLRDEYSLTKRKTKQYFHRACYEANTRRAEK